MSCCLSRCAPVAVCVHAGGLIRRARLRHELLLVQVRALRDDQPLGAHALLRGLQQLARLLLLALLHLGRDARLLALQPARMREQICM